MPRSGAGFRLRSAERAEQHRDVVVALEWVPQRLGGVDLVPVAATDALTRQVARAHEVMDDPLRGALGDPDAGGDVAQTRVGVPGDRHEDVGVVREEGPVALGHGRIIGTS